MRIFAASIAVAFLSASALQAQSTPPPRITVVSPTGAKAGTTIDITVTGQELDNVEGLHFSFPGAKVEVLGAEKAPVDPKGKGGKPPPPRTNQKFRVEVPGNAPLGFHDVRVVSKGGISNPRAFVIGDSPDILEKENNNDVTEAQKVDLNTTISGVIATPTDVDYFAFKGKKGQRIVATCLTSSIDSKLPALIQVFGSDAAGRQLGFSRNYNNNDAVADATLPADGEYYVRVCSFTYTQGGPDYFYRLTIGAAPWIDAVYPPIVEPGKDAKVTLYGRNLPGGAMEPKAMLDEHPLEKLSVAVKAPGDPLSVQRLGFRGYVAPTSGFLDGFEHRIIDDAGKSNAVLIGYARAPVVLDSEKSHSLESAQQVNVPCEIVGRIERKADRDFYKFSAKKGQVLNIEVFADRLGSAIDVFFALFNEKGDRLTEQDDNPEVPSPQFFNRTDDPARYRFTAPDDGVYTLMVTTRDAFVSFGPRHIYVASIMPEIPDFRAIAMPTSTYLADSVVLGQAGHQAFTVFVQRTGGFAGDITIAGDKLPPGLTLLPQVIAGNQKQAAFVVSAAPEAPPYTGAIHVLATAVIGGKKVTREVRSATITWSLNQQQQNTPTVSRLDRELVIAVRDKAPYTLSVEKTQFAGPQGERISIPLKLNAIDYKGTAQISALTLPTGMALQPVTVNSGQNATINLDSKTTVLPGNYTVVLRAQTQPQNPNQQPKPGGPRNIIQTTPPIAVTIFPKALAKVAVPQNNPKIKPGESIDVTIKVARQFDYNGIFKVEVDPKASKGITADPVTIQAGTDEAKLTLKADPKIQPGMNPSVTVRVIAMFNDTVPVPHEAKFNLTVVK